jgi:hypothetical protein
MTSPVVKLAEIQKALNAAADQMKMGADYALKDLKRKQREIYWN